MSRSNDLILYCTPGGVQVWENASRPPDELFTAICAGCGALRKHYRHLDETRQVAAQHAYRCLKLRKRVEQRSSGVDEPRPAPNCKSARS